MHGQAKFSGVQTAEGYVGGSEDAKRAMESPGLVETAPSYVQNVIAQTGKPKGRHLTEGGFVGESANTHGFGNIGSKDDPGREGEKQVRR